MPENFTRDSSKVVLSSQKKKKKFTVNLVVIFIKVFKVVNIETEYVKTVLFFFFL